MRIATLLPIYSILSFISICFPNSYVYLTGWVEVIEGIALYTFLMLLCDFLAPNDRNRVDFFASLRIPSRMDKTKTNDGLTWLQVSQVSFSNLRMQLIWHYSANLVLGPPVSHGRHSYRHRDMYN